MKHFLNDVQIAPRNLDEIGFKSTWSDNITVADRDSRELELNVDVIVLPNEAKDIIQNWIAQNGVFQGIPYRVELSNGKSVEYYVDLMEGAKYRTYDISVKIKRQKAKDNFYQLARDTSFESFAFQGVQFSTFNVPYIIVPPNQVELGITLSISVFVMGKAVIEALTKTSELTAELIASTIPSVGVGVVTNVGAIVLAAAKLAIQVTYTLLLIVALKKLTDQLKELIFPKVRNFKACKIKDLIEKACAFYGYTFKSTLLDSYSGLTLLPVPIVPELYKGKKSIFQYLQNDLDFAFTKGYPTSQDTTPTLWALIESMETMFNAKSRVVDGLVQLEHDQYFKQNASVQINASLAIQDKRQDEYELNTFDSWKRYYLHYQTDYSDLFTLDNFDGTDTEYSTEPVNVLDKNLVTIQGLQDRPIPFALATRKTELNFIEKRAKDLFKLIDTLANTSYQSAIDARVGVMTITNQFYGVTKLMYTVNGKQQSDYMTKLSPDVLFSNYHYSNQIQLNGYKIRENIKVLMNDEIYVNLLNNNWAEVDGVLCELLSLEYKDRDSYATITYREPFDYASVHTKTIKVDG